MEPTRSPQATLNDLIDRILDKGILLNTDLIISVSGIPLLGVNLKLALAGMETMLEYGIMVDWDEAQRAVAAKEATTVEPPIEDDEYIIFSVFGSHWYSKGIYESWRAGIIHVTNKRLLMFRKMPAEVLLEISYEKIKAIALRERPHYTGVTRQELHILLKDDEIIKLHAIDTSELKEAIENVIKAKDLSLEDNAIFPDSKEVNGDFLQPGEEITHEDKIWYQMPLVANGNTKYEWKPGHLYLTDQRLCWWYDFDKKLTFEIPPDRIINTSIQGEGSGNSLVGEKSLIILYKGESENKAACFSCDESSLLTWKKIIDKQIVEPNDGERMETCPRCGRKADRSILLENGCPRCGWVSYRGKHKND